MRDKSRIPKILKALEEVWKENPDLRLGQLIVAAAKPINPSPYIFHIEDDDLLNGMLLIAKQEGTPNSTIPSWQKYPDITRIETEQITIELLMKFIEVVKLENKDLTLTPKSMMQLNGAPIEDKNWLNKQKKRIEKLHSILSKINEKGEIEAIEIGYKISIIT